jgi:hypothetical protein
MTRNGKIALGCGGAGCLGLIVVVIAGGVLYFLWSKPTSGRSYNFNVSNINRNSNSGPSSNLNANSNSTSDSNSSSSSSSLSDDEKHKLYQAASMTEDAEMLRRVSVKLGIMNEDFTPGDDFLVFVKDHGIWAIRNTEFIQSLDSKEKAVDYVNKHFPE